MIAALATPSSLHDGEVTLLPLDSGIPALLVAASYDDEITRWTQVPHGMTLLDAGLVALKDGLGDAWRQTAVLVITEFGRTVRMNGSKGTDHGTGAAAMLVGGAVQGGRVIADWPGLKDTQLYQNRDLAPTADLRAALKGVLTDHLGLSTAALGDAVFPESSCVKPMKGLVAA